MKDRVWRGRLIGAGLAGLRAARLHRLAAPWVRGLGAVMMFHHVRPASSAALRMNRGLQITPDFLAQTIETLLDLGFDILSLDHALAALKSGRRDKPFAALTFDDGFRDNLQYAEPILRRYGAPFTVYVASGFADGAVRAWWEDLEAAIQRLPRVALRLDGETFDLPTGSMAEKEAAADLLSKRLRTVPGPRAREVAAQLLESAGVDVSSRDPALMDWGEIRALAETPLCAIGAHTLTHPRLATLDERDARHEIGESKRLIEARIGRPVVHFAYPYGGADAAGLREFALARELGFASAVTTRPGMIFSAHKRHPHALPRLSVNGAWQNRPALETLLTGLPFALWNRGKRLNVG